MKATEWAIGIGKMSQITNKLAERQYHGLVHNGSVHQLKLLIQHWTDGDADKVGTYTVHNGPDVRRKLYHI